MFRIRKSLRARADQPVVGAAILVSLPVIVLSFVFQRQFVRGILPGSVKE